MADAAAALFARANDLVADDVWDAAGETAADEVACWDVVGPALRALLGDEYETGAPLGAAAAAEPGVYEGSADCGAEEHAFVLVAARGSVCVVSAYGGDRHLFKRVVTARGWLAAVRAADFERAFGLRPLARPEKLDVELRRCTAAAPPAAPPTAPLRSAP